MNKYSLPIILLFLTGMIYSQQRDLDYYLQQAQQNSPLIQKNKNDRKIIELDLQQTERILKNPEINLESNILFAPIITHTNGSNRLDLVSNGSDSYSGYDLGITNGGQYQAFLSLKQPLLGKSNLKVYSQKSDISRKQLDNSTNLTVHELEQLVSYQYILCNKSKIQIKNGEQLITQLDDQLSIMQQLVDNAVYKQTDLLLLQIERQNVELNNKSFEDDYKNNLFDLNLLCGIKDSSKADIRELDIQLKPEIDSTSRFLTSYKLDSLGIVADQNISELKYKPQLNLFANAGLNAEYLPTFNRLGVSAGLTFSWNIYDGNQRKLEREKSHVSIQTLQFEKSHFITQQSINKDKIKGQLSSLKERIAMIENQLKQYDKLYAAYQNELRQGLISVMDFKNLLKDMTAKRQDYLLQKMEKQLLISSYNYWNY
ncbi:MAG: TolC family protein [Bacteroidota bacterium]|nr:TolC family protein [Bacteroidota bacterium]